MAQYSVFAADSLARYSGVSHNVRFAKYSGELIVAFNRFLRCAKAAGSRIFSALLGCAALMPSILRFLIFGSVFNILWYCRIGFFGSSNFCRLASDTSGLGDETPSPPSVKFTSGPPSDLRLKWAIKEHSSACASSHVSLVNRCTLTLSTPNLATIENTKGLRSFFFMQTGFHRVGVFPIPT